MKVHYIMILPVTGVFFLHLFEAAYRKLTLFRDCIFYVD